MKFKEWFKQYFTKENLTENAKTGKFTPEEIEKINAACQEAFKMTFEATLLAMAEEDKEAITLKEDHKILLSSIFAVDTKKAEEGISKITDTKSAEAATQILDLKNKNKDLTEKVDLLSKESEDGKGKKVALNAKVISIKGGAHTATHVFGIEAPLFDINKPWNAVTATRQPLEIIAASHGLKPRWNAYENEFKAEVTAYGESLAARIDALQASGELDNLKLQGIDFSGFNSTGWGEDYIVRRQDALIAYIRTLNSVSTIFPVRYGVQNKESLTNSFLTNFSASFQAGRYFKGKVAVEPIEAQVFDVMIKHKFSDLKSLEKEYIGYLNKEGSDPMKWTWIEWVIARILEVAMNEWNERRIMGYRIEPTAGVLGHHLHGSNGVKRQLRLWAEDLRLLPFSGYNYTPSTVLATAESFVAKLNDLLPSLRGIVVIINEKHIPLYNSQFRTAYGLQQDFTGPKTYIMNYPDVTIKGLPNMGNSTMMIATIPGNIELLENKAGEMAGITMQRDLEELMVMSYWKEGVTAYMVGKKFATAAALLADDYISQYIFFTDDTVELDADATTCNGTKGDWFSTVENNGATVITDITSAKPGVVYRIICGNVTNASTVSKAGKFSSVDAWTPQAVGDYLEVYLHQNLDDTTDVLNGKFINVARKVNGIVS